MTDQTDTLRARIAELERQLAEARRLLKEAVPTIAKIRDSMATHWLERVAALARLDAHRAKETVAAANSGAVTGDGGTATVAATIATLEAENARLLDLFRKDGEQHAAHIRATEEGQKYIGRIEVLGTDLIGGKKMEMEKEVES